jgi:quercetin dioxygenase-like cupin family protein
MVDASVKSAVMDLESTPAEAVKPGLERRIIRTASLMTVVIEFSNGPWAEADPMHSHPHEQTTYVAEGEMILLAGDAEPRRLTAGDVFAIPGNVPHSIHLLSTSARLVDSFTPVREDFLAPQS